MVKHIKMIPQFEKFIRATSSGKRCKPSGERIKASTIANYRFVLKLLMAFEVYTGRELVIFYNTGNNSRILKTEKKYWTTFYKEFTTYLYKVKDCHDNFCGHVFKIIKCFFRYLKNEQLVNLNTFYESFFVKREDIRIISLLPEQLSFLIQDNQFHQQLKPRIRKTKDAFVFGCTTALRFSDLMNLRVKNLERINNEYYLDYLSLKTGTPVKIKLPLFAVTIFCANCHHKKLNAKVFSAISLTNFNKHLKKLAILAGWTEPIGKFRRINAVPQEQKYNTRTYRFCDLMSSHVMRRTGITFLLMLGMPEYLVRKVSGHTANSPSFFRYVNFAQSFMNAELENTHKKLLSLYNSQPIQL